jgi:hypothetical protein
VSVGGEGVYIVGCVCDRSSATPACRSMIAWTSLVGVLISGSISAMWDILKSSTSTAYFTLVSALISSSLGMWVNLLGGYYSYACTLSSYWAIAACILPSTFFKTVSSLTPNLAYRLDSDRAGAVFFATFLSLLSSVVSITTCISAASRRAVSGSTTVGLGAGVSACFYGV